MPPGLAVALLKDAQGDIRLTVPVTGRIGSPQFSLGDAIKTALRNVVAKAVTAPFRLLGKLFRDGAETAALEIAPVEFAPGSAVVTAALERELQRVADFLRASPYVALELVPVVSQADLDTLARRQVTARIQDLQRARDRQLRCRGRGVLPHAVPGPSSAGARPGHRRCRAGGRSRTEAAGWRLAERRPESARRTLVERAGIEPDRLRNSDRKMPLGTAGTGRVEFTLVPVG